MDLRLDEADELLRTGARALLERQAGPERLAEWEASGSGFSSELWERFVDLGWLGLALPADAGGGGGTPVSLGVLVAEIGRAACPGPFLPTLSAALVVAHLGSTKAARTIVEAVARDGTPTALLWPADAASTVTARIEGDRVVLDGGPVAVVWAASAATMVCLAPLAGDAARAAGGIAAVAVDRHTPGVEMTPVLASDNERAAWVRFAGVAVGDGGHLVPGAVADAVAVAEALGLVRLLRAAELVGGAGRVLDITVAHVSARRQFGVPIGSFQAVQHALADVAIALDAARLATWEGLSAAAAGESCRRPAAVAGWLAGQCAVGAAVTAAQLHGGIGAIRDYPLHFYYRRAQAGALRLGSQAAQLEVLAGCLVDPVEAGAPTPWLA